MKRSFASTERVAGVAVDGALLDDGDPLGIGQQLVDGDDALLGGGLDGDERRIVALEPRGVDDDAVDDTRRAEPDDRLIDSRLPPPSCLPAVVDLTLVTERRGLILRRGCLDQVLCLGEEVVVGPHDGAAQVP